MANRENPVRPLFFEYAEIDNIRFDRKRSDGMLHGFTAVLDDGSVRKDFETFDRIENSANDARRSSG